MSKTTTFKHGKVSFSDTGKGRAVVLLHGFLGSQEIWQQTIADLSRSYRVIGHTE
jgi:pimeloyl-ACP methyl ester carboxylesterase